ncbi:disease resistance protein Pik-2-like [Triticum dicoccoides]|uniref:disease resistance protein Pik-2-like n=1 Tax=Triticum dicoccoides TaxID=85692 RepID=UPI001891C16B|nr:disease resistance protein Pik-2-like [Triticum dicoccoides]
MESTAVSIGKSVLKGALGCAKSAVVEAVAMELGVQHDKAFITDELERTQSFLMVAHDDEQDDHVNKVVTTWANQVRDVAYDVEDGLKDIVVRIHGQSCWGIPRTLLDRRHVVEQMKELRAKVEDVSQRNARYRLIDGASKAPDLSINTAADDAMLGVDEATRHVMDQHESRPGIDLAQLIVRDDPGSGSGQIRVIGVWGTSGTAGHTSIILEAYDNPTIKVKFPCRAWVRVTRPFQPEDFVQSMVEQFQETFVEVVDSPLELELEEAKTGRELARQDGAYLNNKRCLIVLTDLSTMEEWHQIMACFPENKMGSQIVVSAEQVEVASLCPGQKSMVSKLKKLSAEQTIYAFHQQSFQDTTYSSKAASSLVLPHTIENEIQEGQSYSEDDEMTMIQESLTHTSNVQGPLEESRLIGREKEISYIIELIQEHSSTQQIQVIAVWGKGGVGKSTLISDIYHSQEVNQMFEKHAYVTVLQPFKIEKLLSSLIFQLDARKIASRKVEDFTGLLDRCLQEKSCLIVLDDLSSTMEWDIILPCLLAMNSPSLVILITTRHEDIGKHCCKNPKCICLLNGLDEKGACDLFIEKVFKDKATDLTKHYPELVEPANLILKKCNGLPLAILTIGGFLAEQPTKTVGEWTKLDRCISLEMEMNPKFEGVETVLMKSYDGLPYYLKSCILYLSIFLEDRTVSRRRLVCRWVAEGYSEDTSTAKRYFMELLERSMILPTQISLCSIQGADSCQVHDPIRDIIIEKSLEENLVFRLEEGCNSNNQGTFRHLSISSNWDGDEGQFEATMKLSCIRSLTVFGKWRPFYISDKMRFLRVLDLEGTEDLADHHLEHIGNHLHLRYLSLRGCEGIYYLPDSVGNLRQLETLDIKYTRITRVPRTIAKLSKLCQLKAGNEFYIGEERPSLACCVPFASCCAMVIQAYAVKVPVGIGELKSLNTLRCVHLEWENAIIQEIEGLTNLRKLGVFGIDRGNGPEFCSAISGLGCLESLSVRSEVWDLCDILNGMSSPPKNLRSLKLLGWMDELPQWIKVLQNLVKIKLESTEVSINDEDMRILGNLPNLSILSFKEKSFQSALPITLHSGLFRSLMTLELVYMDVEVGSLEFEASSMPKLEVLSLRLIDCKIGFSGLEFLPSIKEVRLLVVVTPALIALNENMTEEEAEEEARHREDEVKADMRKQLANNENCPIMNELGPQIVF